jgi:hypothetical protein
MQKACVVAVAVVLLGMAPLLAADSATVVSIPRPDIAAQPGLPNFVASSITVGQTDPFQAVPCFNCVPGAGVVTLGLSAPRSVVTTGSVLTFALTGEDLGYSGGCTFTYSLSTSLTGPPVQSGSVPYLCYPAIWVASFPTTAPSTPGRYVLKGAIYTESGTAKSVVTSTLIVIQ